MSSKIDAGLELISALGAIELKSIEIRELLYKLITKDYNIIDKILEIAQKEKLLQRTEKTYLMTPQASNLHFEKPKIIKQEENAKCKFCGKKLSTGYYVEFKSHTYGPYGSSCIRKIHLDHLM
jgi:hypothetical protein